MLFASLRNGNSEEESKEAVIVIGGDEVGLVSTPPLQATPTASEVKDDDSDRDSSVSRSVSKSVSHVTRSVSRSLRSATRSVQRTSKRMTSVAKSLSQSLAQGGKFARLSWIKGRSPSLGGKHTKKNTSVP